MNTKTPCFFFFNNNNIYICLANEGGAGGARKQNRNEWQVWHRGDFRESRLSLYPSAFFFPFFVNEQQFILARLRRLCLFLCSLLGIIAETIHNSQLSFPLFHLSLPFLLRLYFYDLNTIYYTSSPQLFQVYILVSLILFMGCFMFNTGILFFFLTFSLNFFEAVWGRGDHPPDLGWIWEILVLVLRLHASWLFLFVWKEFFFFLFNFVTWEKKGNK